MNMNTPITDVMDMKIHDVARKGQVLPVRTKPYQAYVNGFMLNPQTKQLLLIEKNRPDFQKGKWNGIGGKIEPNEQPIDAMVREFREETDVQTRAEDWEHTLTLQGRDFRVVFFRAFVHQFPPFRAITDEPLGLYYLKSFFDGLPALDNARWIVPLQFAIGVKFPLTVEWVGL